MKMISTTMRYDNTFLLIGGKQSHGLNGLYELKTLIKYEPDTDEWAILPQTLKNNNAGFVRMMVKSIIFPSCAIGK